MSVESGRWWQEMLQAKLNMRWDFVSGVKLKRRFQSHTFVL